MAPSSARMRVECVGLAGNAPFWRACVLFDGGIELEGRGAEQADAVGNLIDNMVEQIDIAWSAASGK